MRAKPEGKYDAVSEEVLKQTEAAAALVIVVGGNKGNGFSMSIDVMKKDIHEILFGVPFVLRQVADQIEKDNITQGIKNSK